MNGRQTTIVHCLPPVHRNGPDDFLAATLDRHHVRITSGNQYANVARQLRRTYRRARRHDKLGRSVARYYAIGFVATLCDQVTVEEIDDPRHHAA